MKVWLDFNTCDTYGKAQMHKDTKARKRTIRWPVEVDKMAKRLSDFLGIKRGVSGLLEILVRKETGKRFGK